MKQKYIDKFIQKVLYEDPYLIKNHDNYKTVYYKVGWFKKVYINVHSVLDSHYVPSCGIFDTLFVTLIIDFDDFIPIDDLRSSFREHILRAAT